ncbi:hypothetical protein [Streptomyces sp. NPDC001480]|uniref:hypothetical protein n=1 Tax=Streptomyces sp. NPDC001480 TaxID=3364577 RepID=UPI0036CAC6EA
MDFDGTEFEGVGPEGRGAVEMFLHEVAHTHARELSTWLGTRDRRPRTWQRATDMSDMTLRLTPELADELVHKVHDLIDAYRLAATREPAPAMA